VERQCQRRAQLEVYLFLRLPRPPLRNLHRHFFENQIHQFIQREKIDERQDYIARDEAGVGLDPLAHVLQRYRPGIVLRILGKLRDNRSGFVLPGSFLREAEKPEVSSLAGKTVRQAGVVNRPLPVTLHANSTELLDRFLDMEVGRRGTRHGLQLPPLGPVPVVWVEINRSLDRDLDDGGRRHGHHAVLVLRSFRCPIGRGRFFLFRLLPRHRRNRRTRAPGTVGHLAVALLTFSAISFSQDFFASSSEPNSLTWPGRSYPPGRNAPCASCHPPRWPRTCSTFPRQSEIRDDSCKAPMRLRRCGTTETGKNTTPVLHHFWRRHKGRNGQVGRRLNRGDNNPALLAANRDALAIRSEAKSGDCADAMVGPAYPFAGRDGPQACCSVGPTGGHANAVRMDGNARMGPMWVFSSARVLEVKSGAVSIIS
jgi:hypothetical protein